MRVTLTNRPVRLNTTPSAATLASLLAQQEAAIAGATRYGFTDRLAASAFISDSIEADFAAGAYRQGYVQSDQTTMLPGWTFSRTGAATAESAGGGVQSFTSGQSRITDRGLLMERAATNYVRNSRDLTAGYWARRNAVSVTVVPAQTRPDGSPGANLISNLSGGGGANDIYQITAATPGARYEPSFDLKRVSTQGLVTFQNPAGGGYWSIDLALCPDRWTRITRHHAAVTVLSEFVGSVGGLCGMFWINLGSGALSFYVDNCQIEAGTAFTSRIVTSDAEASRAADAASFTTAPSKQGALYVEADLAPYNDGAVHVLVTWSDGLGTSLILFRNASSGEVVMVLYKPDGFLVLSAPGFHGARRIKVLCGWADGQLVWTIDGVERGSAPLPLPPSLTTVRPGSSPSPNEELGGSIRRLLVARRLPTPAQRIAMTEA